MAHIPQKPIEIKEELSFKVVETYEKLLTQHDRGEITIEMLDCAVRAIIAATGWALTREVVVLLSYAETD